MFFQWRSAVVLDFSNLFRILKFRAVVRPSYFAHEIAKTYVWAKKITLQTCHDGWVPCKPVVFLWRSPSMGFFQRHQGPMQDWIIFVWQRFGQLGWLHVRRNSMKLGSDLVWEREAPKNWTVTSSRQPVALSMFSLIETKRVILVECFNLRQCSVNISLSLSCFKCSKCKLSTCCGIIIQMCIYRLSSLCIYTVHTCRRKPYILPWSYTHKYIIYIYNILFI